jgi:hypothetical protein
VIELRRKPDQVIVHRIEMQQKERELIEQAMMVNGATSIIKSLASMDIKTLYALLTIIEGLGIINTPIPTIGDGTIADALNAWAKNGREIREQREKETGAAAARPEWVQKSDNWLYSMFYSALGVENPRE